MANLLLLTGFLTICVAFNSVYGLICYKCDSADSTLCAYGITSFVYPTVDCSSETQANILTNWIPKQCVKIAAIGPNNTEYIARGCIPHLGGACETIVRIFSFFTSVEGGVKVIDCWPCDGDRCNSANAKIPQNTLAILAFTTITILALIF